METKHYRTIFLSDIHLGSKDSKAELLLDFLKHNTANTYYLVGDIIDLWKVKQNKWKWKKSHTDVVRKFLKISKQSRVIYVIGNHDEAIRPFITHGIGIGKIQFVNKIDHIGSNGKRYLVIHGDMFDGIGDIAPWLGFLGDKAYDLLLDLNTKYNWIRHKFGFGYWSFSKVIKKKVKNAVDFIFKFEHNLVDYCRRKFYDGVVAGHIHHAEIKSIEGIHYLNTGDFVESCTAIVEHFDGNFEIIVWDKIRAPEHEMDIDSDSSQHVQQQ
jgi:UDP-2,3-diacylglucosamine pyrophosphatase LpxH